MNLLTYDNQLQQLQEDMLAFTSLTGIHLHLINNLTMSSVCTYCNRCSLPINSLLNSYNFHDDICIYFCPVGFCHIASTISNNPGLWVISEPIICDEPNGNLHTYISHQLETELLSASFLTPVKITQASRLVYLLTNRLEKPPLSTIPYHNFKKTLFDAIDKENVVLAKQSIDQVLEIVLANTGLDFYKTKIACIKIIFMMHEISTKYPLSVLDMYRKKFEIISLIKADTIGKLKDCLLCAGEDFIQTVFQASSLKRNTIIARSIEFVEKNYMKKINQNSVSRAVYLSSSYFSKLFKEITGYNFTEYLNQVRIQKAKELLENSSLSIDEIPAAVGFANRSYFGKVFKKLTGITPKRYRNSC